MKQSILISQLFFNILIILASHASIHVSLSSEINTTQNDDIINAGAIFSGCLLNQATISPTKIPLSERKRYPQLVRENSAFRISMQTQAH